MSRYPFNLGKIDYREAEGMVIYRSKMHVSLKRNSQLMPGGDRQKAEVDYAGNTEEVTSIEEAVASDAVSGFRARTRASWAKMIRKVYEVDPLICPNCGAQMRPVAVIEDPAVIERILRHVGAWAPLSTPRGPPGKTDWPVEAQLPTTYEPLPPIG